MTFPIKGIWYLIDHDKLKDLIGEHTNWLNTDSWLKADNKGGYSSSAPNKSLIKALQPYCLDQAVQRDAAPNHFPAESRRD